MAKTEEGTKIDFLGGNNEARIGGNSLLIEHTEEGEGVKRVMIDCGALFPPEWTGLDSVIPDVRPYLGYKDQPAEKTVDAMFISHCHEDHIGGLVHLARAGYKFPEIYTSSYTKELLKTAFKEGHVPAENQPEVKVVSEGQTIDVADNVHVSPFNVSHSTVGAMGFHVLTTIRGRTSAGIVDPGDYRMGESKVGPGFEEEKFVEFLKDKPVTHVLLDSTSSDGTDEYLVDFDHAVANTLEQVNKHPEKQVISAVISRSIQNLAIDLETAKQANRTVFIDGYWAKLAFMAMQRSGIHDYDEVVYKSEDLKNANAKAYLAKYNRGERYIIPSGAFAESKKGMKSGLYKMSEQQKVTLDKDGKVKGNSKGEAGHPDFTVDKMTLILARQRCIEAINGKQVRAMYNRLAALGATIVENRSGNNTGKFETALMQRTGHAVRSETKKFIELIVNNRKNSSKLVFIPIHGDVHQLANTAKVVREAGGEPSICHNADEIKVWAGGTKKLEQKPLEEQRWIAVQGETLTGYAGGASQYTYTLVNKDFTKVADLMVVRDEKAPAVVRDYASKALEKAREDEDNYYVPSRKEVNAQKEKLSRKKKKELVRKAAMAAGLIDENGLPIGLKKGRGGR